MNCNEKAPILLATTILALRQIHAHGAGFGCGRQSLTRPVTTIARHHD
jgi:hypothetical protein